MSETSEITAYAYVAAYSSPDRARRDYKVLRRVRSQEGAGALDVALVFKDDGANVHLRKRERDTGKGAITGVGVGALLGILIPFAAIPVTVSVNAAKGGLMSYYRKGMSRADIRALGEALGAGEAALVVLSGHDLRETLDRALQGADATVQRRIQGRATELEASLAAAG